MEDNFRINISLPMCGEIQKVEDAPVVGDVVIFTRYRHNTKLRAGEIISITKSHHKMEEGYVHQSYNIKCLRTGRVYVDIRQKEIVANDYIYPIKIKTTVEADEKSYLKY